MARLVVWFMMLKVPMLLPMLRFRIARGAQTFFLCVCAAGLVQFAGPRLYAQEEEAAAPRNVGHGLREIAGWTARSLSAAQPKSERSAAVREHLHAMHPRAQSDAAGRVVADVILDGSAPPTQVRYRLAALGLEIFAEHPATGRSGAAFGRLSAWLPVERTAEAAAVLGVQSLVLVHRPWKRVGKATSQGVRVLRADALQARNFTGKGIRIGVISDSYDLTTPHAAADVASDDLPGPGNPAGRIEPVVVLQDGDANDSTNTDEGRAMLQIIHDVAPDATLAFNAVGATQTTFASAVRNLRNNPAAPCDIICDDIGFANEPFFSDGIVAQAVDDVVTRTDLPGRPVIFYSAAGNSGDVGFECDWTPVSDAAARSGGAGGNNLQLTQVPVSLTAGGFLNFAAASGQSGTSIVQRFTLRGGNAEINLQWNDLFIPGQVTTDYNLLVFNAAGTYLGSISGTDNNAAIGEAVELVTLTPGRNGAETTYQLVITRASTAGLANHLRYVVDGAGFAAVSFTRPNVPTLFGHSGARNADGVAAYDYSTPTVAEEFNSSGPVKIYFDAGGNRLAQPEVRQQPTIAAVDGVDTTFFPAGSGMDPDSDGFPNFFGTSAAAPHVAGVAALLLQAGGGPGSISAANLRAVLGATANPHDLDPNGASGAVSASDGGQFSLSASGDNSDSSAFAPDFFTFNFIGGPAADSVNSLTLDLGPAKLKFDQSATSGFPFTVGRAVGIDPAAVTATVSDGSATNSRLTINFPANAFRSGSLLAFGIDRDLAASSNGGNSADFLDGATFSVRLNTAAGEQIFSGTLRNRIGNGYSPVDGPGLLNAWAALERQIGTAAAHPSFFAGEVALANGVYFLAFPQNGNVFGYYSYALFPYLYHFDLGFEYFVDANDGQGGAYLYDFASGGFFFTSPGFPFPYLYDFKLNALLYYFSDPNNPGRYSANPRFFFNFATGQIITK